MKRLLLAALLLLTGCGVDLDTTYGSSEPGSVNGFSILERVWQQRFGNQTLYRLGDQSGRYDTLIHLQREKVEIAAEAWDHLEHWVMDEDGRQCLVVLRDGAMAPWLLDRWLDETRGGLAAASDEQERKRLARVEEALRRRRADEFEAPVLSIGESRPVGDQTLVGIAPLVPKRIEGLVEGPAPPMLRLRSTLEGQGVEPVIEADGVTWLGVVDYGSSRLLVAVNAIPLMDGSLVDANARRLLQAIEDGLGDYGAEQVAWVRHLRVSGGDPLPPSILRQLFATPPFSYVAWHLLILLLLFAWFRAAWLGRVNPRRSFRLEHFSRHIEALAWRLRRSGSWRECVTAVARHVRREPPVPPGNEDGARAAVADLLNLGVAAIPPRLERSPDDRR